MIIRKNNPKSKYLSGIKIKILMSENKTDYHNISKAIGVPDRVVSGIVRYEKKILPRELKNLCNLFNVKYKDIQPNQEELELIKRNENRFVIKQKLFYREYNNYKIEEVLQKNIKEIKKYFDKNKKIILNNFIYMVVENKIDIYEISEATNIELNRLVELEAFNECFLDEFIKIYTYLYRYYFIHDYSIYFEKPIEIECSVEKQREYAEYAAELYSETKSPDKFSPFYFWKRACLSEEYDINYKMPEWFEEFAEMRRSIKE